MPDIAQNPGPGLANPSVRGHRNPRGLMEDLSPAELRAVDCVDVELPTADPW